MNDFLPVLTRASYYSSDLHARVESIVDVRPDFHRRPSFNRLVESKLVQAECNAREARVALGGQTGTDVKPAEQHGRAAEAKGGAVLLVNDLIEGDDAVGNGLGGEGAVDVLHEASAGAGRRERARCRMKRGRGRGGHRMGGIRRWHGVRATHG